jgi:hypothetical protein
MQEINRYQIELGGRADERTFGATSPVHIRVESTDALATQLVVNTDQSGLIGLLRYLHQQGFLLLSVHRTED